MIEFHLDGRSGVPAYLQLVQQVRQAVRLGILRPGDQLPTVKEVVAQLTINPNTVLHAYRQLDLEGVVEGRRGVGTFVASDSDLAPLATGDVKGASLLAAAVGRACAGSRPGRGEHGGAVRGPVRPTIGLARRMSEAALSTEGLGKRYGSTWALHDCDLEIPPGTVTALVGPNGAGKTTLLQLAIGLLEPTAGSIAVLGHDPRAEARSVLPHVGFVAQDHPLPRRFRIAETLRLGRELNPHWDDALAARRIDELGLSLGQHVGTLSGGQQAQVALTLALAKRPQLLLLDEPVASLDPLARREFLNTVVQAVAETGTGVVLSSHIVADLERICDRLIILAHGRPQLAGTIEEILAGHRAADRPAYRARSGLRASTT